MPARDDYPALARVADSQPNTTANRTGRARTMRMQSVAALAEIDRLRQLVLDLYDPNDCHLVNTQGSDDAPICVEHNHWDPGEEDGRACPHWRARQVKR